MTKPGHHNRRPQGSRAVVFPSGISIAIAVGLCATPGFPTDAGQVHAAYVYRCEEVRDPRLSGGWTVMISQNPDNCIRSFISVAKEPIASRSDANFHYGMAFSCDAYVTRELIFYVPGRFPAGSDVGVTLRRGVTEVKLDGDVSELLVHVRQDPNALTIFSDQHAETELRVELRQGRNIVRGTFQLDNLAEALAVFRRECAESIWGRP